MKQQSWLLIGLGGLTATALYIVLNMCHSDATYHILGGVEADINEFKYMVSLGRNGMRVHCGATILDENHVLTAAHCVNTDEPPELYFVERSLAVFKERYIVDKITQHERYIKPNKELIHSRLELKPYDAAVLRLRRSITPDAMDLPVQLVEKGAHVDVDTQVVTAGWGKYEHGSFSTTLRKVDLKVTSDEDCRECYKKKENTKITPDMICAGNGFEARTWKDTSGGDSGGPLIIKKTNLQLGIAIGGSTQRDCPSVYVNVAHEDIWNFIENARQI